MAPGRSVPLRHAAAQGFTLVELLVSLGLISLLMLMFAEVFQIATGTMSTQRGVMENDQRARTLTTVIGNDLANRSMRAVIPYQPGESDYSTSTYYSFANRQGFFSISENDPNSDTDDVLHFTTYISAQFSGDTASHDELYFGRAGDAEDYPDGVFLDPGATLIYPNALYAHPNQPEVDNNSMFLDYTAASPSAEIVYFLRNGNLYRRVLLIREPINDAFDAQPKTGSQGDGDDLFSLDSTDPIYYPSGRDFLKEFDFSARFQTDGSGNPLGARFVGGGVGVSGLENGTGGGVFAIARPLNRFGHNPIVTHANGSGSNSSVGNPREFLDPDDATSLFLGRFTHQETSDEDFNYPHSPSAFGTIGVPTDPVDTPSGTLEDTTPADGIIDQYDEGTRRGEDILMTHVHSFNVQVWDEIIGDYVDIGHALTTTGGVPGDFYQTWDSSIRKGNARQTYGPLTSGNRTFDTWHAEFDANNDGTINNDDRPPFLPKQNYTDFNTWQSGQPYTAGAYCIPTNSSIETFYYQCVQAGTSGVTEPTWPVNDDLLITDGTATWQAVYNLKRLRSIQITIRYFDVTSEQMRQVTLLQSLMN